MTIDLTYVELYIEKHLPDISGAEMVAEELGYSYHTLRRAFRDQERRTLGSYIAMRRVERAKLLLCQTSLTCYQICDAVGWSGENSGARVFKRFTDMTMGEYRQQR
jgi:AraC-like DNA-binding protein